MQTLRTLTIFVAIFHIFSIKWPVPKRFFNFVNVDGVVINNSIADDCINFFVKVIGLFDCSYDTMKKYFCQNPDFIV